jgi:hypothetical protein
MRITMVLVCLASATGLATADTDATVPAAAPPAAPPAAAPAAAPTVSVTAQPTGATLRNGFSLSVGEEVGSGPSSGLTGQLYGVDWRIGAHISDQLSVYADTHLSFGTAKIGGAGGVTGNFAAAILGEYTLPARVFVAGGGGYGVLNNPSGPLAQFRLGWYPSAAREDGEKSRRLNIALDSRFYFAGDQIGTVSQISLTLGYDRF